MMGGRSASFRVHAESSADVGAAEQENVNDSAVAPVTSPATTRALRPFIKWAGGKSALLPEILASLPPSWGTYFEPFLGSGALFFALASRGPLRAVLADINSELVATYLSVRDNLEHLVVQLAQHEHSREYFYRIRALDREPHFSELPMVERASRFIYLNKTCFNGLYRVNSRGEFNVPFGDYVRPRIADLELLGLCSHALRDAEILCSPFTQLESRMQPGDFVYFDPPYVPLSATANFTGYASSGFTIRDQEALADLCRRLDARGIKFLLSNSETPAVRELYRDFHLRSVLVARAINSKGERRGKIGEVLICNYER